MKIWILTKKTGILLAIGVFLLICLLWLGKNDAVTVSGAKRDLPIYCVDKGEEKVISISFDAA
ncbi:hypothetical protein [Ructibacterium gallinarum]|uniref:Uncharacterized protein n=1 Tax=Ructibacterium gallinarum TaxID=2779355 RepID=A0A9D5M676_9FIRM|nr:hypothetical protein [Ructibacterium gallinarum]MBE5040309.1 hypothetical protein [Ructibacterium gallinarum]